MTVNGIPKADLFLKAKLEAESSVVQSQLITVLVKV